MKPSDSKDHPGLTARFLMLMVRVYQILLSPLKSLAGGDFACCRFQPSCSHYAIEAMRRHGAFRGTRLALKRILKCHPWGGAGYDPVP
jgi:putative membrane protein insertion efficiency factor